MRASNLEKVAIVASVACIVKFLIDNITITIAGTSIALGHVDAMTYATFLTPLWGAHAYTKVFSKGENVDDSKN